MANICGDPYMSLQPGTIVNNATIYSGTVSGIGVADINVLSFNSFNLNSLELRIIKTLMVIPGTFGPSITLYGGNFTITPTTVTVPFLYTITFEGYSGYIKNYGNWTAGPNYVVFYPPVLGSGAWTATNAGGFQFNYPSHITGPITLKNGSSIATSDYYPGTFTFDNIIGEPNSYLYLSADTVVINRVTAGTLTDLVYNTLTLNDFTLNTYGGYGSDGSTTNFVKGSVDSLSPGDYVTINISPNVQVKQLVLTNGDVLNSHLSTPVVNFQFNGGQLNQTVNGGVFQVSGTTTMTSMYTKSFGDNTILKTVNLDCTQCQTPDCGLPLNQWNHIDPQKTNGCII
jgi:hypothetical protein